MVFQLIFVGALPGICEELMFRGVMLPAFERRGRMYGVVVSAALFALMHGSVSGLPVHFGLGMLMGLMAVRLDSPVSYTHLDVYKRQMELMGVVPSVSRVMTQSMAPSLKKP